MAPKWTEEEHQYLLDNYERMSDQYMADILGRTLKAVETRRYLFGLKKSIRHRGVSDLQYEHSVRDRVEIRFGLK